MTDWALLTKWAEHADTLSHLLLAVSPLILIGALFFKPRYSVYVTPESLVFQGISALLYPTPQISTLQELHGLQIVALAVTTCLVLLYQSEINKALPKAEVGGEGDVEPLLAATPEEEKEKEEGVTPCTQSVANPMDLTTSLPQPQPRKGLVMQWPFIAYVLLGAVFFSTVTPWSLLGKAFLKCFDIELTGSYADALAWQTCFVALCLNIMMPFSQYSRLLALHGIGPDEKLAHSPLLSILTPSERKRKPKMPLAVWTWLIVSQLGPTARIPRLALDVATSDDTNGAQAVLILCMAVMVPIHLIIILLVLVIAPKMPQKPASPTTSQ